MEYQPQIAALLKLNDSTHNREFDRGVVPDDLSLCLSAALERLVDHGYVKVEGKKIVLTRVGRAIGNYRVLCEDYRRQYWCSIEQIFEGVLRSFGFAIAIASEYERELALKAAIMEKARRCMDYLPIHGKPILEVLNWCSFTHGRYFRFDGLTISIDGELGNLHYRDVNSKSSLHSDEELVTHLAEAFGV